MFEVRATFLPSGQYDATVAYITDGIRPAIRHQVGVIAEHTWLVLYFDEAVAMQRAFNELPGVQSTVRERMTGVVDA